jgi:hypothetical protein
MELVRSFIITFSLLLLQKFSLGSPTPGVGSSHVHQLLKNIAVSEYGFRIGSSSQTFWNLKQNAGSSNSDSFQFTSAGPQTTARFSVNIDKFSKPTGFDSYVKKWVKEYQYFGFEILKTQITKIGGQPCYLVDFAHRKKNKQMRQFVVVKPDLAVVMTCADEIEKFKDTSVQCADLINNFQWTTPTLTQ